MAGCEDRGEVGKDGRVFANLRMCELGVSTVDNKKDGQMIPRVWRRTWWGQAEIPAGGRYPVINSGKLVPRVVLSGSVIVFEDFFHCVREQRVLRDPTRKGGAGSSRGAVGIM